MTELRVMTRIVPEGCSLLDFPPLPEHAQFVSREIYVINYSDPLTGMNYKKEDIYERYNIVPGITPEMAKELAAQQLQNVGFLDLEENGPNVDPEGLSFQVSVPKVISQEEKDAVCVSVVDNKSLKDFSSSRKSDKFATGECSTSSNSLSSNTSCKSNYPSYKMKKCENSSKLKYKFKTSSSSQEDN